MTPPLEPEAEYGDAVSVAFAAFGTPERKILKVEMRTVYFQSMGARALQRLTPAELARITEGNDPVARYVEGIPETQLRYIRRAKSLKISTVEFDNPAKILETFRAGWEDAAEGFTPYDWETFVL
jgi:hypothetical protein